MGKGAPPPHCAPPPTPPDRIPCNNGHALWTNGHSRSLVTARIQLEQSRLLSTCTQLILVYSTNMRRDLMHERHSDCVISRTLRTRSSNTDPAHCGALDSPWQGATGKKCGDQLTPTGSLRISPAHSGCEKGRAPAAGRRQMGQKKAPVQSDRFAQTGAKLVD